MHYGYLGFYCVYMHYKKKYIESHIYMAVLENYEILFIGKSINRNSSFPKEVIILNNLYIHPLDSLKIWLKMWPAKNKPYLTHSILYTALCSLDKSMNHILLIVVKLSSPYCLY